MLCARQDRERLRTNERLERQKIAAGCRQTHTGAKYKSTQIQGASAALSSCAQAAVADRPLVFVALRPDLGNWLACHGSGHRGGGRFRSLFRCRSSPGVRPSRWTGQGLGHASGPRGRDLRVARRTVRRPDYGGDRVALPQERDHRDRGQALPVPSRNRSDRHRKRHSHQLARRAWAAFGPRRVHTDATNGEASLPWRPL